MKRKLLGLLLLLMAIPTLPACFRYSSVACYNHPRRIVRPDGCRVRRVIYPCRYRRGNLKKEFVTCNFRRPYRRSWIRYDRRCRYSPRFGCRTRVRSFDGP